MLDNIAEGYRLEIESAREVQHRIVQIAHGAVAGRFRKIHASADTNAGSPAGGTGFRR
ncbi:MAG: hypothetical protein R2867_15810 [Caldilineaceae bacterium]